LSERTNDRRFSDESTHEHEEPVMPIYLQYDSGKVKGDVTEAGHKDWIEISAFGWGVGRAISARPGKVADRESSAPSVSEVKLKKVQDCATVGLLQDALTGEGVWAQVDFCKTDSGKLEVYMSYLMENTMISGYSVTSSGDRAEESLSLNFTAVECKVIPMGASGAGQECSSVTYDLATAKT
jgi:type VI secretion system secreted protein Hcp